MTTVGLLYKQEDPLIVGTAKQIAKELKSQGYKINLAKAKLIITLGGDGTVLRAARMVAGKNVAILGVHMGGLGFLSETTLPELNSVLEKIKKGDCLIDERSMIEATVNGKKLCALNDIVIGKTGIARVIKFDLEGIADYTADGIIFSTASGATAYNLSAGGPLLSPDSKSMVVTPICPHTLSSRPMVLERPVTVVIKRGDNVILTADGQKILPLKKNSRIKIERSKHKTKFIRLKGYNFFKRVAEAFGL